MQCLFLNPTFKPLLMTKMDVGFPCVLKCSRPVPLTEEKVQYQDQMRIHLHTCPSIRVNCEVMTIDKS